MRGISRKKGEPHIPYEQNQLTTDSGFIRDLMAFPSNQDLNLTPIELNHNSRIVRYFIDFIMAHSTSTVKISMEEFQQLLQLSDKFQADKVDKILMLAMGLRIQQRPLSGDFEPWAVFVFAANP